MGYRSRERVAKILSHEEADRVPYDARRSADVVDFVDSMPPDADFREFCLEGDFATVSIDSEPDPEALRPYLAELPEGAQVSSWGVGKVPVRTPAGDPAGSRTFYPLAGVNSLEELRRFPFPDLAGSGADEGLEKRVADLKTQGYTVLGQMSQTILETAYEMRGMPQLMADFYERPEYVEALFERIAEQRHFQARRYAEAGVDIVRIGDDIATQHSLIVSPALYRERIKPLHAAIIASARAVRPDVRVKYHSDGNLTPLLRDLIDIGVDIINPVQPECMDIVEVKREFGRELTLWGCMPVQSVLQHGSKEDVLRHIRLLMEHVAPGGGLVINFINFLSTRKSDENLRYFLEVFYEMGRYGD